LPAAYVFIAIILFLYGPQIDSANQILSLIFAENYAVKEHWRLGHLWSLGVQEQFYLIWPALFVFMPRRRIMTLLVPILAVPLINVAIIRYHWPYWNTAFYSVADTLAWGCLLALIRKQTYMDRLMKSKWPLIAPFLVMIFFR
jgi:peptidoglycan/LPS O-acetylase OafA/YrhL